MVPRLLNLPSPLDTSRRLTAESLPGLREDGMSSSELVVDGVTERSNGRTHGPLVVLEGTNAAGKSSVVSDLAERLKAQDFHFPPAFVAFREEVGLDSCVAPIPRLVYYLGGILHLSSLIGEAMTTGPVVCDRYAASPLG